jgi:DNA-binding response OmpR family regulator
VRILLVDDHDRAMVALAEMLARHGHTLHAARDAAEGEDLAHAEAPDAILLDLPSRERALDLLRSWRRRGLHAPIVFLWPRASVEARVRCLDLGADACLTKPVCADELLARLRALARAGRRPPGTVRRTFDLEVNTTTRMVKRSGRTLHLTPQEYDLLVFLLQNQGSVVTRSMIHEHLYPADESKTSNVIDVYIRYLRNKIDRGFDPPLVLTKWGQGYCLRAETSAEPVTQHAG